ncbi:ATP-binding protein [Leptolyngbya boryana CZ1]|uniref:ATP-binding protein n=1 Tax=Leptolyngbya boryana CZ1 TaxID=3060204 RepID=A0AA96WRJ3_LEPBY|nr:ATP-binding protein [Leptolyngbya boryana]WNZ44686.1 ATP-binding protein [Leptolyngbya boryana CZ1]
MPDNTDILTEIFNAFHPYSPLEPGDSFYVDCHAVRGNDNILRELGWIIERSNTKTCQIYTGHRGVGKSTELLRLRADLIQKGFHVIYFAADSDLDEEDAQYTDILLACTRRILEDLKAYANPLPLVQWLESRWQSLKDLALTSYKFEELKIEEQIPLFAKLTATLRTVPTTRQKIREQVDIHSVDLLKALNEFIGEARSRLGNPKLVVIVDNLDRIAPISRPQGGTNHDEIFLDRNNQLRGLDCHMIYTVPISLIYSNRATQVRNHYGDCQVLPMLMVKNKAGKIDPAGIAKVEELIQQRIQTVAPELKLVPDVFDMPDTLTQMCLMSGGHMREVMQLMQGALTQTDTLPIRAAHMRWAVGRARENYEGGVDEADWSRLAEVYKNKRVPNEDSYRKLLFNRFVLEYRYMNELQETVRWHDVHPLVQGLEEFRKLL